MIWMEGWGETDRSCQRAHGNKAGVQKRKAARVWQRLISDELRVPRKGYVKGMSLHSSPLPQTTGCQIVGEPTCHGKFRHAVGGDLGTYQGKNTGWPAPAGVPHAWTEMTGAILVPYWSCIHCGPLTSLGNLSPCISASSNPAKTYHRPALTWQLQGTDRCLGICGIPRDLVFGRDHHMGRKESSLLKPHVGTKEMQVQCSSLKSVMWVVRNEPGEGVISCAPFPLLWMQQRIFLLGTDTSGLSSTFHGGRNLVEREPTSPGLAQKVIPIFTSLEEWRCPSNGEQTSHRFWSW